jgi:hypothetical protein
LQSKIIGKHFAAIVIGSRHFLAFGFSIDLTMLDFLSLPKRSDRYANRPKSPIRDYLTVLFFDEKLPEQKYKKTAPSFVLEKPLESF